MFEPAKIIDECEIRKICIVDNIYHIRKLKYDDGDIVYHCFNESDLPILSLHINMRSRVWRFHYHYALRGFNIDSDLKSKTVKALALDRLLDYYSLISKPNET